MGKMQSHDAIERRDGQKCFGGDPIHESPSGIRRAVVTRGFCVLQRPFQIIKVVQSCLIDGLLHRLFSIKNLGHARSHGSAEDEILYRFRLIIFWRCFGRVFFHVRGSGVSVFERLDDLTQLGFRISDNLRPGLRTRRDR